MVEHPPFDDDVQGPVGPDAAVEVDEFEDVGRTFGQPAKGPGFDGSPAAHMWRTMIWPGIFR